MHCWLIEEDTLQWTASGDTSYLLLLLLLISSTSLYTISLRVPWKITLIDKSLRCGYCECYRWACCVEPLKDIFCFFLNNFYMQIGVIMSVFKGVIMMFSMEIFWNDCFFFWKGFVCMSSLMLKFACLLVMSNILSIHSRKFSCCLLVLIWWDQVSQ